ncbi:phosphoglycerate mutase-like protein [Aulographum hederae CBS 113979]|uniref:Phosphoglycerate mutase-like protein n=1 Tax=Aulographum hederae CBS 113979 TaxID=1176131 RepID=A0A6G1H7P8_9PEZI|nr:phosphoglycerate mutase-like protein [Aulographum hederae CBS 113979]
MRLFLIRHGETVDNVAQLYAGSRDSQLTNHGFQQATRLGEYLAKKDVSFSHIFSSQLQRAVKTAEMLKKAQSVIPTCDTDIEVKQVSLLMEQDFGFYEGKSYLARPRSSGKSGREAHWEEHKNEPGFVDIESKTSMIRRADEFLDDFISPILDGKSENGTGIGYEPVIAIVSHGILLSVLWKRLLLRIPRKNVVLAEDLIAERQYMILESLGGWSNTGYLELALANDPDIDGLPVAKEDVKDLSATVPDALPNKSVPRQAEENIHASCDGVASSAAAKSADPVDQPQTAEPAKWEGWSTKICAINSRVHLAGLKRTGGGVGSSKHDEGQKTIESFFKRQRTK